MKIALLGDIALIGKYDLTKTPNIMGKIEKLSKRLSEYDYVVGNLETPLTNKRKTSVCKSMHLRTPTDNIEILKYLHINAVSLANNHIYDFGRKGLEDTIKTLEDGGIKWLGVNDKNLVVNDGKEKVSLSGFCCYSTNGVGYIRKNKKYGVNALTYDKILKQLDMDMQEDAFSILSLHWGDEHTSFPNYEHICLANKIANRQDLVIYGHHPHVIQGVQKINNSFVAYSLGNFLFDDCVSITGNFELKQNLDNKRSFILEIEILNHQIINVKCQGFKFDNEKVIFFDIEDELSKKSEYLNKIEDIEGYELMRKKEIRQVLQEKFGKRNLKWLIRRMNYYSIGAKITAVFRHHKYSKESAKFI